MKDVILVFPDTASIADFILGNRIKNAEVSSVYNELTAKLTDQQIVIAEISYHAFLKKANVR